MSTSTRSQALSLAKSDAIVISGNNAARPNGKVKNAAGHGIGSKRSVVKPKPLQIFDEDSEGEEDWQWVLELKPNGGTDNAKARSTEMPKDAASDQRAKRLAERRERDWERWPEEEQDGSSLLARSPKKARLNNSTTDERSSSAKVGMARPNNNREEKAGRLRKKASGANQKKSSADMDGMDVSAAQAHIRSSQDTEQN